MKNSFCTPLEELFVTKKTNLQVKSKVVSCNQRNVDHYRENVDHKREITSHQLGIARHSKKYKSLKRQNRS
ncbi:hypothetical protein JOC75_000842 [Metabacillus crassostreae]|nr:hypothetical protein [Metabacillus crassostreae]